MKKLLFALISISILAGCKTEKEGRKVVINEVPLKTYFQNSNLPAAIMGYSTREGQMDWYAFGPSIWGGKDTISENNIFRIYSMTKAFTYLLMISVQPTLL